LGLNAFLSVALAVVTLANPFAHADWNAMLRSDATLTVDHFAGTQARDTCVDDGHDMSGCYMGGAASGDVNGTWLAAIPIDGMGTGGVMWIRLYVWRDGRAHYLTALDVYKAAARIENGQLVVRQPAYAHGECNACATEHSVTTYTISGGKLKKMSSVTLPGA
jgi:hypothetical protein